MSTSEVVQSIIGIPLVHRGDIMSTLGGYHENMGMFSTSGGYHEYIGGIS